MIMISKKIPQLLITPGLIVLMSCSSGKKESPENNNLPAVKVSVSAPSGVGQQDISVSGQVESSQVANISTRVMGIITSLNVKTGDHVSKGQLLVTINNEDIMAKRGQADAMISEAQAALVNAQKDFDRFTTLYNQQSATAKELDNVTLQYNAAKARVESAREVRNELNAGLGYTRLIAPFSGVITQKLADAGSMANPGAPLLTVERNEGYQVSASVPENRISQVHQGAEVSIKIKSVDKTIKGIITQINPSSQFSGGQYIIKVSIPDIEKKGLYTGMYTTVFIPVKEPGINQLPANGVMVPLSSIEHKGQLTGLYTVGSSNTALLRWVRLGKTYGDKVEVLSGLGKDEQFILSSESKLYNGIPVTVR
jgi:RND family efflux transporter MFP subunit